VWEPFSPDLSGDEVIGQVQAALEPLQALAGGSSE
jgi:hypothetical protein